MKIGILTFHRAMNYGATLQAYALGKKIEELGAEADVLDYRSAALEEELKFIKKNERIGIKTVPKLIFRFLKHRRFFQFMKENMKLSTKISTKEELEKIDEQYDAFIVGSDQVWNDGCIQGDATFVLQFVKNEAKRFSYAASIGGDDERAKETVRKYGSELAKFKIVSVRENNIRPYMESVYGNKVRCDVDPVLLLNKSYWEKIMSPRRMDKPYVFVYMVGGPKNIRKFANDYAKKYNMVVVDNKSSIEFMKYCSPQDFLSWIYYADAVVTNSFHGTAFSVLFEKNIYAEYELSNGYNYRSRQLLENVGITGREIVGPTAPDIDEVIDYDSVGVALGQLSRKSENYLLQIINKEY